MTAEIYRCRYPVVDDALTTSQAVRAALDAYSEDAMANRIIITGRIEARMDGDHVIVQAAAAAAPGLAARIRHGLTIVELAEAGWPDTAIGRHLGLCTWTVASVRGSYQTPNRGKTKAAA